jgi:hypothetical protein
MKRRMERGCGVLECSQGFKHTGHGGAVWRRASGEGGGWGGVCEVDDRADMGTRQEKTGVCVGRKEKVWG